MVEYIMPHPKYPDFMIGTDGSVFNTKTKRFIGSTKGRYLMASIREFGAKGIHVLVAETFIKKPKTSEELFVNHKDLNKHNNRKDNLEWTTRQENTTHAILGGAILSGENNPKSILTNYQVVDICKRLESGESTTNIARDLGLNITTIHQIKSGDNWSNISKDFNLVKKCYSKKLSKDQVVDVCKLLVKNTRIRDIVKMTDVSKDQVVKIKSRKNHSEISKHYDW